MKTLYTDPTLAALDAARDLAAAAVPGVALLAAIVAAWVIASAVSRSI